MESLTKVFENIIAEETAKEECCSRKVDVIGDIDDTHKLAMVSMAHIKTYIECIGINEACGCETRPLALSLRNQCISVMCDLLDICKLANFVIMQELDETKDEEIKQQADEITTKWAEALRGYVND